MLKYVWAMPADISEAEEMLKFPMPGGGLQSLESRMALHNPENVLLFSLDNLHRVLNLDCLS